MSDAPLGFLARLRLALRVLGRVLNDTSFAGAVLRLEQGALPTAVPPPLAQSSGSPPVLQETAPDAALQVLALLQREGRFVDFLEENVTAYSDAEVGGAARAVHAGCRKVIHDYFTLEPVRTEAEGARLTLPVGFDPAEVRVTGNVAGQPPFTGILRHQGWRVSRVGLPKIAAGHDPRVLVPAEVEL